jgi:hypothetical protein
MLTESKYCWCVSEANFSLLEHIALITTGHWPKASFPTEQYVVPGTMRALTCGQAKLFEPQHSTRCHVGPSSFETIAYSSIAKRSNRESRSLATRMRMSRKEL